MYMESIPNRKPAKTWRSGRPGVLPLRKYPTAKITGHTIRTPITYAVSEFKDFIYPSLVVPGKGKMPTRAYCLCFSS
jgi:hypothetical protein